MRTATYVEVLRRGAAGESPVEISNAMHIGRDIVTERLAAAGWPDVEAIAATRRAFLACASRDVWAIADDAAQLAHTVRLNPDWVHAHTEGMDREDLRALVAVMAAMLPADVHPRDALAWFTKAVAA